VLLRLHPRDWIEYLILRGDGYEPRTLEFVRRNLAPGHHALCVGVNFGLHLLVAAKAVGPTGSVIGVEPQPATILRAVENVSLNGFSNITLVLAALGGGHDVIPIGTLPPGNSGSASLIGAAGPVHASLLPLRDLLAQTKVGHLDLMILDVEGYEIE